MEQIYISGRITGLPLEVARQRFAECEARLRERYPEAIIYNPMRFCTYELGKKWQDYMHQCLSMLEMCDSLILLPNWRESHGAQVEYHYAHGLKIPVYHYAELLKPIAEAK